MTAEGKSRSIGTPEALVPSASSLVLTSIDFRGLHILHYRYIPKGQPGYDPLYKIRPFLTPLLHHFKEAYTLGREVSVDESMIAFKGRISFIQYLPNILHRLNTDVKREYKRGVPRAEVMT